LRKDYSKNLFYQDAFQPAFSQIRSIYPNRISQNESDDTNIYRSIVDSIYGIGISQNESNIATSNIANLDNHDLVGGILQHIYGTLNPKNTGKLSGTLKPFDQREFASPASPADYSMADIGFVYIPASCEQQQRCRVHIVLHEEGAGPYIHHYTYLQWADTNNLIILFPQTIVGNPATDPFTPLTRGPVGIGGVIRIDSMQISAADR
jgi:hypothetical protein